MDKCDSQRNMSITLTILKNVIQNVQLFSLPTPSQPFHVRGRFVATSCRLHGKERKGLVKKRQQATEMHNPIESMVTSIKIHL